MVVVEARAPPTAAAATKAAVAQGVRCVLFGRDALDLSHLLVQATFDQEQT